MFVLYLQLITISFNSADTYSRNIVTNDSARCVIVHSGCSIRITIVRAQRFSHVVRYLMQCCYKYGTSLLGIFTVSRKEETFYMFQLLYVTLNILITLQVDRNRDNLFYSGIRESKSTT